MIKIEINGQAIECTPGLTILEVARQNGIDIPSLCHDERIRTYGACGICVVEVEGMPKLLRSCSVEATHGMDIKTDSEKIRASRKVTLDFLLSDHSGDCRPPCAQACPGNTDCQGYVGLIANGEYKEALKLIKEQLPLPASVGLVCPHPCETACRRQLVEEPIAIAALKVFAAEVDLGDGEIYRPEISPPSGKKVAVIGSGPAGLTAAYFLATAGHSVTVYEAMPKAGGMLRYGIPEYRLPKKILDQEIDTIRSLGVEIVNDTKIGRDITLADIRSQSDAVFLGIGAWKYSRIGCPGEDLPGVIGGIDFLRRVAMNQPDYIGARVAVIGGGNTAMDAARTAVRLGAENVMVLYRRTREEMPAEDLEIHEAMEEGVDFRFLVAPDLILEDNGKVAAIRMQKMELGPVDSSGRRSPVPIPGEIETIAVDTIIAAIGQQVDMTGFDTVGASRWRTIAIDDHSFMTNLPGVFAGGDGVTGPGIAIAAVGQGKKAAEVINSYLAGETVPYQAPFLVERADLSSEDFEQIQVADRVIIEMKDPVERRRDFSEVAGRMTEEEARREGARCLECGCRDYFECRLIKYANEYSANPAYIKGEKHRLIKPDQHPFIERDTAKCILCGLCVRICDELMGVNALGLVQRGFDTVVQPEFGLPLNETSCISCGQCVSVCPTGALMEKYPQIKNIPLQATETITTCSFCGMGCKQVACSHGNSLIRMLPTKEQILCARGRFGFGGYNGQRIKRPLIKVNGTLKECSWVEAYDYIAGHMRENLGQGKPGAAIFAAPNLTLEELTVAKELGRTVSGAPYLGSFSTDVGRGLKDIFGETLPSSSAHDVETADLILMVGSFNNNQVMPVAIRQAVTRGAELIVINQEASLADDMAKIRICLEENNLAVLRDIIAATLNIKIVDDNFQVASNITGYEGLVAELQSTVPSDQAREVAVMYEKAKSPVIIVDGFTVTIEAVQLLADLALLKGHSTAQQYGRIMVISPGGNTGGLWQTGFQSNAGLLINGVANQEVTSLFVLGEDPAGGGAVDQKTMESLDLLVVLSPYLTATAEMADVVLPASAPLETSGHYLSSGGARHRLNQVVSAPAGKENQQILKELIDAINPGVKELPLDKGQTETASIIISAQFVIPAQDKPLFARNLNSDPTLDWFSQQAI